MQLVWKPILAFLGLGSLHKRPSCLQGARHFYPPVASNPYPYLQELENITEITIRYGRGLLRPRPLSNRTISEGRRRRHILIPVPAEEEEEEDDDDMMGVRRAKPFPPRSSSAPKVSSEGTFRVEELGSTFNFTSVGGYRDIKAELVQIVDFLLCPEKYTVHGVRVPKGVLLEGPPGNGKTLLARGLAGEANTSFIASVGSQFAEKYVGVGAARVRELFDLAAAQNRPCIVFIDELDAVGKTRSGASGQASDAERDQTLNQLLVYLDGFGSNDKIMVMGATNRVDMLDPALVRAGRFDKTILVPNPDAETRYEILRIHTRGKPLNISIDELVHLTAGFSGAQIETVLNEATLFAIRNESLPVSLKAVERIKDRMILGQTTRARNVTSATLRRVAIHEIGHALTSIFSSVHGNPTKVSIEGTGATSLGFTMFESDEGDEGLFMREHLEDKIKVLLGGRAAEEVVYGSSVSSGSVADLESAFTIAKEMILSYGMGSKIIHPFFSDQFKKDLDSEIHQLITTLYRDTLRSLQTNRRIMMALVQDLLEKRVLRFEEIATIIHRLTD